MCMEYSGTPESNMTYGDAFRPAGITELLILMKCRLTLLQWFDVVNLTRHPQWGQSVMVVSM